MYSTHQTSYYPMDFFIPMETIDPSTVMESSSYQNVISHVHPLQISYRQEEFTLSPLLKENSIDFIGFQPENIFDSNFSESTENYSPLLSPVISPLEDIFGVSNQDLIYEQVEEEIEEDDEENDPDWSRPNLTSKKRKTVDIQDNIQCTNCGTTKTPLWRRNPEGLSLCNACGLFLKLHGVVRPLSLKTDVIKKRNRNHGNQKTRRNVKKKKSLKRTKKTNSTRR